jgi:peptidyl-prolyl cis-trans isomerase SurA
MARVDPRQAIRLVALSGYLLFAAGQAAAQVVDRIVAVVDRQVITLSDVQLAAALGLVEATEPGAVRDHLVDRALIMAEVARYTPPEPSGAEVEARLAMVRARAAVPDVARALRRAGLDAAWLRSWARQTLLVERYLEQRFGVTAIPTDEQVEQYYRERQPEFVDAAGTPLPQEAALARARERLTAERRDRLVTDWMGDLRRRATIELRGDAR